MSKSKTVHYTDWGRACSQIFMGTNTRIACTQTWHEVGVTDKYPNLGVEKSFDDILYTTNHDQVTCDDCQDFIQDKKKAFGYQAEHEVNVLDIIEQEDGSAIINLELNDEFIKNYMDVYKLNDWDQEHFQKFFLKAVKRELNLSYFGDIAAKYDPSK